MADKLVNVVTSLGEIKSLPESQVDEALFQQAIKGMATPEQVAAAARAEKYGTPGQMALTAAEGLAKGITFSGSTLVEKALGVSPEDIAGRAEESPVLAVGGEVAGMMIPSALTGGAGLGAGAAKLGVRGALGAGAKTLARATPVGLLETGGRALESATARAVGEGLLGRGAQAAVSGAMWGAAGGAGQAIGEQALGNDPQFNAEALLAAVGTGALLGGGIGGAARLLGGTLAKGATRLTKMVGAENAGKASDVLATYAAGQGTLPQKTIMKLERAYGPEWRQKLGAEIKENKLLQGLFNSADDINKRANEALQGSGKRLEEYVDKADDMAIELRPDRRVLAERLRLGITSPLRAAGSGVEIDLADRLEKKYLSKILAMGEQIQQGVDDKISLKELWNFQKFLDTQAKYDKLGTDPLTDQIKAARGIVHQYFKESMDAATMRLGEDVSKAWQKENKTYQAMKFAEAISKKADLVEQTRQSMGIEPLLTGAMVGGMTTIGTGDFSLGAAGAAMGSFAASRFQTQVSTLIKKYGTSALAVGLDDLGSKVAGIQNIIRSSMKTLAAPQKIAPAIMLAGGGESLQARYDAKAKQYDALTTASLNAMIDNKLRVMGPIAPETLAALKATTLAAVQHIQAAKPKKPVRDDDLFLGLDKTPQAADREMARWLRVVAAAENPIAVIRSAGSGGLTYEGADTLRKVYPALYGKASKELLTNYGTAKKRPASSKTRTASMFLGSPVASYHSPKFTANCQKLYATKKPQGPSQRATVSIDKQIKGQYSGAQALEARRI